MVCYSSAEQPPLPPVIIHPHLKLFDLQTFAESVPKSAFVCLHDSLIIQQKNGICFLEEEEKNQTLSVFKFVTAAQFFLFSVIYIFEWWLKFYAR